MVRILRYERTTIAQIARIHAAYGPMALCISPDSPQNDTGIAAERRHGMNLARWRANGYQFVLIGRNPARNCTITPASCRTYCHSLRRRSGR